MTTATLEASTTKESGPAQGATTGPAGGFRRHVVVPTVLGDLTLVAEGEALVGVYYPEHRPAPDPARLGTAAEGTDDPVLAEAAEQLIAYLAGRRETFTVATEAVGSDRARQVWALIAAIPRGATTTYTALGRAVGVGPRAAGQFVARNPLSVIVPCHRVVASDGRLTGYAGGVDVKRRLLELEGALEVGTAAVVVAPAAPPVEEAGS